jgi:hypothetical protein
MTHKNDYMEKDYEKYYKSSCIKENTKNILTPYGVEIAKSVLMFSVFLLIAMACWASISNYYTLDKLTKTIHTTNSSTTTNNK